jgi:hypothetical protein
VPGNSSSAWNNPAWFLVAPCSPLTILQFHRYARRREPRGKTSQGRPRTITFPGPRSSGRKAGPGAGRPADEHFSRAADAILNCTANCCSD